MTSGAFVGHDPLPPPRAPRAVRYKGAAVAGLAAVAGCAVALAVGRQATAIPVDRLVALQLVMLAIAASAAVLGPWMAWRWAWSRYRLERRGAEAIARLQAVFDSTRDGILILAADGRIEAASAAAGQILGCAPEDLIGSEMATIVDTGGDPDFLEKVAAKRAPAIAHDRVARRRDGGAVPIEISFGRMALPDGMRIVASLHDATQRLAAERRKDEFIATISHELRTPLTSIVGALGLLRGGAAGSLSDAAARLVDISEANSRRLIRLVNDILDVEGLGSGRLALAIAPSDLADLAERALRGAEGMATPRDVRLTLKRPAEVLDSPVDAERLLQVIGNLLSNAIRFSPAGGTVTLKVERRGANAVISVHDEGPGVPREFRERLFGRFAQSAAGAAIPGGSGLGLAISLAIIRAHGGDIWYSDAAPRGACFWLSLPLRTSGPPPVAPPVLIHVGRDDGVREVMALALANQGRVLQAADLASARRLLASCAPALLIVDADLPDGSGVDLLADLPEGTVVPVIVCSATPDRIAIEGPIVAVVAQSWDMVAVVSRTAGGILARASHPGEPRA